MAKMKFQPATPEEVALANQQAEKNQSQAGIEKLGMTSGSSARPDETIAGIKGYDPLEMSREQAYRQAFDSQTTGDIAWRAIRGLGKQAVGGFLLNLAGNDPRSLINDAIGNTTADYQNSLHKLGLKMLDESQKEDMILDDPNGNNNGMFTGRYLAKQVQGLGLTAGIMIEGFGEQALFSLLTASTGGATGELQAVEIAKTLQNLNRLNKLRQFGFGAFQGIKEAHMNSIFTGDEERKKALAAGYSITDAQRIGNETATRAFRIETLPLMLMNGLQWGALGHYNPFGKAEGEFMGASGAFESLASKMVPKLGKTGAKVAEYGIQMASEAFEEAAQDIPSGLSQYITDKKYNMLDKDEKTGRPKTLSQYLFNEGMRDDAVGGAFGGIMFNLLGKGITKGMARFGARRFSDTLEKQYNNMVNASMSRSMADLQNLRDAMNSGDEQAVTIAREHMNRSQATDALHWDYLKGSEDTNMFNSRIEHMNTILKAVEDNDTETLDRYKINNDQDKKFILENYPKFVDQALEIKEDLEKNLGKSVDFHSALELTELGAMRKSNQNELNRVNSRITELTSREDFRTMPAELQQYAMLEAERKSLEGNINRTEEQIKRREEIDSQIEALKSETFDPKNLTEHQQNLLTTLGETESLTGAYNSKVKLENAVRENVADVAKMSTAQGQVKIKQDRLRERLANISSISNEASLDEIKSEASKLGMLTPELKNTLNTKKKEIRAQKKAMKNVTVENTESENNKKAQADAVEEAKKKKAAKVQAVDPVVVEDIPDDLLDFDPETPAEEAPKTGDVNAPIDIEDLFGTFRPLLPTDDNKKKQFKQSVSNILSALNVSGKKVNLKDIVSFYATKNFQGAEKAFNYIVDALKENGVEVTKEEADKVYNDVFGIDDDALLAEMAAMTDEKTADQKGIETAQKTAKEEVIKKADAETEKIVNDDYPTDEEEEVEVQGGESANDVESDQITEPTPKIPFLGVQYDMEFNPVTGSYEFVTKGEDLNRDGKTILDKILNLRLFHKGTKFRVAVATNWREAEVQVWTKSGDGLLTPRVITMAQWMTENGYSENEAEWTPAQRDAWRDKVPMEMWYKTPGDEVEKVVGMGVHDVDWWNERNTASFTRDGKLSKGEAIAKQQKLIQQGKAEARRIRQAVIDGNGEMVVTKRRPGHSTNIPATQARQTLSEANPNASVGIIKGEQFVCNSEKGKKIVNKEDIINFDAVKKFGEGLACMLTEVNVDEKGKVQYAINMLVSNEDIFQSKDGKVGAFERINESLKVIEKYVRLLHKYSGKEGSVSEADRVMYQRAVELKEKIAKETGYNIAQFEGNVFKGFNQLKNLFPREKREEKKNTYDAKKGSVATKSSGLSILIQTEGFKKDFLPIVTENADGTLNVENYSSKTTGKSGYVAFLRDHMTTAKKFFQITDEHGEKQYTTYPQPILQYDLANPTEKKAEEVVEEKTESTVPDVIAADYLLTGGVDVVLSSDYFLKGISGIFTKASDKINSIKAKYIKEINSNYGDLKNFIQSDLYKTMMEEISNAIKESYSNNAEVEAVLVDILKYPTGLPVKLGNQISVTMDKINEITTVEEKKPITEISHGQKQRVIDHIVNQIVKTIGSDKAKFGDIVKELSKSFENYIEQIKDTYPQEYKYLTEHKDEILGFGKYQNTPATVREKIEEVYGENIKESDIEQTEDVDNNTTDEVTHIEKNLDAASYEYAVKNSLSARLRRMFMGIEKVNKKGVLDEFAGLAEYWDADSIFDTLQRLFSDTPNSIKDLTERLEAKLKHNPVEFEFLRDVIDRINEADKQLQNEFLFKLNQTKNDMFFIMAKDGKDGYSLSWLNANSKEPIMVKQKEFKDNFKQSPLVTRVEDGYTVNKDKANEVNNVFDLWVKAGSFENLTNQEVRTWLENFGIFVTDKTIEDWRNPKLNGGRSWNSFFEGKETSYGAKGGLFYNLNANLIKAKNSKETILQFDKKDGNVVANNNGGYLKDLATVEVANTVTLGTVMRIAGKNVMPFSQPNFVSEQVRKLKDKNNQMLENLKLASFSKHSHLLEMLENNPKLQKIFNVSYIGLQAIKESGTKNRDDLGVTNLSATDFDVLMLAFMTSKGNSIDEKVGDVEMVSTKMGFPPLSDSSQMFVMDTAKLDLKEAHFTFNADGTISLSDSVLEYMFEQLVLPDLQRICDYRNSVRQGNKINIEFQEVGSQIFTILPELNTLDIDGEELLHLVHTGTNLGKTVVKDNFDDANSIIDNEAKEKIKKVIQETVLSNAKSKFDIDNNGQLSGTWLEEGLVEIDEKKGVQAGPIDNDYLKSRSSNGIKRQLQIATLDFAINNYVHQAQVQMLFAGDLNNYTEKPKKMFKDLNKFPGKTKSEKFFNKMASLSEQERAEAYVRYMQLSSVNLFKRLKEQLSPGNRLADSKNKVYSQLIINDKEGTSNSLHSLAKLWHPEVYESVKDDLTKFKELEQQLDEMKEVDSSTVDYQTIEAKYNSLKSSLEEKLPRIADYMNITTTDGQEFTTWREHLDCLYYQGKISEDAYISAGKKLQAQSEDVEKLGYIQEQNRLSQEEKDVIFQPMKPLHAGMYFEKKGDYTLQRFVYVKTSSFPLVPEMTLGLKFDNIRKNIEKFEKEQGTNVRVTYRSGIKVGATDNNIDVEELYNDNYDAIKDKMTSSTIQLNRENFSIQQDKPFKTDKHVEKGEEDYINMGTQIDKILFGNGINKITEKVFPNQFDKSLLDLAGVEEGDMLSGEDLYKIYNAISIKQQEIFRKDIFEELGVDERADWYNSPETLERIQELLNNRLSNYQDREIIRLNYKVAENNAYSYYTKEELAEKEAELGRKLNVVGAEFDIPIWISPNSQKFESVLNSIVTNRTVKLKLPGSSSPVGSQEGFVLKKKDETNLTEKERTGIIFTPSYNPETGLTASHYADGSIKTAQVLLPSKYRTKVVNEKGKLVDKLIDLREYTKEENGRVVLDMEKVDPELLKMFSFRIPTSSHQSGSTIEIVGFLPHEMGDLMIVPKDHVTQIGEDFDIDVRYYYRQHYVVENGKLVVLNESHVPTSTKDSRKKLYDDYTKAKNIVLEKHKNDVRTWVADKKAMYNLLFAENELDTLLETKAENANVDTDNSLETLMREKVDTLRAKINPGETEATRAEFEVKLGRDLADLRKEFDASFEDITRDYISARVVEEMQKKLLENNQIALYKSIYSSSSENVQKKILATLSTDFAKDTANLIDKTYKGQTSNPHFSVFDDRTQKEALRLGASGKLGIGVHSNWVVFNSLLQQQKEEDAVRLIVGKGENGPIYLNMTIGNTTSDGRLGMAYTLDGKRTIATVNMENQNCSTDNQKLQIMGKRNENKYTINVFSLLCNLGFDTGKLTDGTEVHIPSMFISQPIIRRYVELQEQKASIFSDFSSTGEESIIAKLKEEFGNGVEFLVTKEGIETTRMTDESYSKASLGLTPQSMLDNMTSVNNEHQWAVLQKFLQLKGLGTEITKVQRLLNIEKDGLGISVFNTLDKKDALILDMFDVDTNIENVDKLFGERELANSQVEVDNLKEQGFTEVYRDENGVAYMMRPTTAQNAKIINSLSLGYNLWSKVFPFEDKFITEQINTVLDVMGIEKGTSKELEVKYKVVSAIKDFVYAFNNRKLFDKPVEQERVSLTVDSATNTSLATYLNTLKKQGHPLFEQPFFKNLEFDIFSDGKKPSLIKYTSSANSALNKNDAHSTLERLVKSDTKVGVPFNGNENYTYNDLVKDLTKYAMLSNQENGAIGFRNYIPMAALKEFGVNTMLKRVADTNSNYFNLLLNGEVRAILKMTGNDFFNNFDMEFTDKNTGRDAKEASRIISLIQSVNQKFGFEAITWNQAKGTFKVNGLNSDDFNSIFIQQYFQHNPEDAKKFSWSKKKEWLREANSTDINKLSTFYLEQEGAPDYISVKIPKSSNYALFKHVGENRYQRINTLGGFGMNEFSPLTKVEKSLYAENNVVGEPAKVAVKQPIVPKAPTTTGLANIGGTVSEVVDNLLKNSNNTKYNELLSSLKQFAGDTKVILVDGLKSQKGIEGLYHTDNGNIYLDSEIASNMNTDAFNELFIEEFLHSLTSKIVKEHIEDTQVSVKDGKLVVDVTYKEGSSKPYYITKLVGLYKQAIQTVVSQASNLEEGVNRLNELHIKFSTIGKENIDYSGYSTDEVHNAYRVFNMDEFIAGVFVDKDFRKLMSETKYVGTDKSLLDEFKDFIKRVLNVLSNGSVEDSIMEHTIDDVFRMLNKKDVSIKPQEVKEAENSAVNKAEKLLGEGVGEKKTVTPELPTSMEEITNHSGGAYGADTMWDIVGRKFGVTSHKHYREGKNTKLSQRLTSAKVQATVLTKEQMDKARAEIEKLLGKKFPDTTEGNLQVRNYYQVANADAVFAVAPLKNSGSVTGGTNTAVQLGIKMNKPVYVWDTNTEKWFVFDSEVGFQETDTPTLPKNFAGVGTRDVEKYSVLNKDTQKWEPRKEYLGIDKEWAAEKAIKEVYEKTKKTIQGEEKVNVEEKKVKGIEISSNSKGLGAALTNPTELAKSKGNISNSYPIRFGNRIYKDVEEAYQDLKSHFTKDEGPNNTYSLMVGLLKAKLEQYPALREEITKLGGSEWILASTHQPTSQNSVWETGGKNWFIKALNEAYLATEKKEEVKINLFSKDIIKMSDSLKATIDVEIEKLFKDTIKTKALKNLTESLFNYIKHNNIPVNIIEAKKDNAAGGRSMIYVNEDRTGYTIELDTKGSNVVLELLHELIHITTNHTFSLETEDYAFLNEQLDVYYQAFVKSVMNRGDYDNVRQTIQDFRDKKISREELEKKLTKEQLELLHAASNAAEFVSSFISSKAVQTEVTTMTHDKNLFEELIKWINNFFEKLFKGYSSVQEDEVINDITKFITDTKDNYRTPKQIISMMMEEEDFEEVSENIKKNIQIDDDFQYFGTKYSIQTEDGKAVDVPGLKQGASETNTKFAERKQKILNAYNKNPNVDAQNGKPFRGTETQEALSEPVEKGKDIGNGIKLNQGQEKALNSFKDFLDKSVKHFLLKGRGGTGKSTIAAEMMYEASLKGYTLFATAISDAATSNLKNLVNNSNKSLNVTIANFASMFGLTPVYDKEGKLVDFDLPKEDSVNKNTAPKILNSEKALLVFDESSMVGEKVMSKIKAVAPDIRILFMGDNAQIKPIGNTGISELFNETEDKAELTEVMRQKENSPILSLATTVAKELDDYDNGLGEHFSDLEDIINSTEVSFNESENKGLLITNSAEDFINQAVEDFKKYPNKDTIVITGNNDNVEKLNRVIRDRVHNSKEPFVKGERLMTYSKYSVYNGPNRPKTEVFNSSVVTIEGEPMPTTIGDGVDATRLTVSYTKDDGTQGMVTMNVIHKQNKATIEKFYAQKNALNAQYKVSRNPEILKRLEEYNKTVLVDYNYAMTAHKVQGQTVRNTYVVPTYRNFSVEESRRMFYTSITRPTDKLVIHAKDYKPKAVENLSDYEVFTDSQIDTSESVDLRPSFETLLSTGRVETQGFYLTLEEFNSMSKEEQDNFKKCL